MEGENCIHLYRYIENEGLDAYHIIHRNFCLAKIPKKVLEFVRCIDCERKSWRMLACLSCTVFACSKEHFQKHLELKQHFLAVDISHGKVFCFLCEDYVYHPDIEASSRKLKEYGAKKLGIDLYLPFEPNEIEINLLKQHQGRMVLYNNSIGLRGIVNENKVTCYMNCIIQVLINTPIFRDYFLSDRHECKNASMCSACEVSNLFQEFFSEETSPLILLRLIYIYWDKYTPVNFSEQQDAQEFFEALLLMLDQHCVEKNEPIKDASEEFNKQPTLINQIFYGQIQRDTYCICGNKKLEIESFLSILLYINTTDKRIMDCLRDYTKEEIVESQCGECKAAVRHRQTRVHKLPIILSLHIKRSFSKIQDTLDKKVTFFKDTSHVSFPEHLDMTLFMSSQLSKSGEQENDQNKLKNNMYCLYAVVRHNEGQSGKENSGHFMSYIKHRQKWYKHDDDIISCVDPKEVFGSQAYILFYHKEFLEYE